MRVMILRFFKSSMKEMIAIRIMDKRRCNSIYPWFEMVRGKKQSAVIIIAIPPPIGVEFLWLLRVFGTSIILSFLNNKISTKERDIDKKNDAGNNATGCFETKLEVCKIVVIINCYVYQSY